MSKVCYYCGELLSDDELMCQEAPNKLEEKSGE